MKRGNSWPVAGTGLTLVHNDNRKRPLSDLEPSPGQICLKGVSHTKAVATTWRICTPVLIYCQLSEVDLRLCLAVKLEGNFTEIGNALILQTESVPSHQRIKK